MDYLPGKFRRASSNPYFLYSSGATSIASVPLTLAIALWPEAFRAQAISIYVVPALLVFSILAFGFFSVALYDAFQSQKALRRMCYTRHEISHVYRDEHGKQNLSLSRRDSAAESKARHGFRERDTIGIVNQKIANMFREVLRVACTVETYLCTPGPETCIVVARSERGNQRDKYDDFVFTVEKNTAFAEARKERSDTTSHFLCGDLVSLSRNGEYKDEREWHRIYQSRLVIPIRYRDQELGFLSLDTKSRHRINHTDHVEILASLADDMYVFLHASRLKLAAELRERANESASNAKLP